MCKIIIVLLLVLLPLANVNAQPDTIMITDDHKQTVDKYDQAYKVAKSNEQEISHLWKVNLSNMGIFSADVGLEQKIGKTWSSDTYLRLSLGNNHYLPEITDQWEFSQQLKYYYNLNRRERLGRKTNGFNANYISLGLYAGERNNAKHGLENGSIIETTSWYGAGIRYGMQRRIGNIGFIELYAGIKYQYRNTYEDTDNRMFDFSMKGSNPLMFYPEAGIRAGFALQSFSFLKADTATRNGKINHLWKVNLIDLEILTPNIGFEFRLGNRWTSDSYLRLGLKSEPTDYNPDGHYNSRFVFDGFATRIFELNQQVRYYPGLFNKQVNGGFSGVYLSLGLFLESQDFRYTYSSLTFDNSYTETPYFRRYGAGMRFGYQCLIGNVGYVDVYAGFDYRMQDVPGRLEIIDIGGGYFENKFTSHRDEGFVPVIGIKAGFAIGSRKNLNSLTK